MLDFVAYSLVEPSWVAAHLDDGDMRVVDARGLGDGTGRKLYQQGYLPGAVHLDWQCDLSWVDGRGVGYLLLPPAPYSYLQPALREMVSAHWDHSPVPLHIGASWTTDAPFRETEAMIAQRRAEGILAVEMEAAALYALAQARQYQIICFAHVTNQMGQTEGDFEKGKPREARPPSPLSAKRLTPGDKGRLSQHSQSDQCRFWTFLFVVRNRRWPTWSFSMGGHPNVS